MIINHRYIAGHIEYLLNPNLQVRSNEQMVWKQSEKIMQENQFLISNYWLIRSKEYIPEKPKVVQSAPRPQNMQNTPKKPQIATIATPPPQNQVKATKAIPNQVVSINKVDVNQKGNTAPTDTEIAQKQIVVKPPTRSASHVPMGITPAQQKFTQNVINEQKAKNLVLQTHSNINQKTIIPITQADYKIVNEELDFFKNLLCSTPAIAQSETHLISEDPFNTYIGHVHNKDLALSSESYLKEIFPGVSTSGTEEEPLSPPEVPIPDNNGNNDQVIIATNS